MDAFSVFVPRVVRAMNDGELEYMFTGAMASSYYGRPKFDISRPVITAESNEWISSLGHGHVTPTGQRAMLGGGRLAT